MQGQGLGSHEQAGSVQEVTSLIFGYFLTRFLPNLPSRLDSDLHLNNFPIPYRFKEFKEGREDYRGQRGKQGQQQRTERTDRNIAKIRELLEDDARMTFEALSYESGISVGTVRNIIVHDLGFTKKSARWVPRLLTPEHKAAQIQMAEDFKAKSNADPDFKKKVGINNFRHFCIN